jgi:hypothetical protein
MAPMTRSRIVAVIPVVLAIIGPRRSRWDANHIEAEAIGRKAVRLPNTGDWNFEVCGP